MKKLVLTIFWIVTALAIQAQKLQVTDFAFFNDFRTPTSANLPDFFNEKPESLDKLKSTLVSVLKEKYAVDESVFNEKSISFNDKENEVSPSKSYKENHKSLIKKGGFDYYLSLISSISPSSGQKYAFEVQVKLANGKGKKVYNNSFEVPFSTMFRNDNITTSDLLLADDFYALFEFAINKVFQETKEKVDPRNFYRPIDPQFEDFIGSSSTYQLMSYASQNPVLKDEEGSEITIRIRGGSESEIDITNANEGLLLMGERINAPIVTSVKNPMVKDLWTTLVQGKSNSGFEELNLAPSADIHLQIGNQENIFFRLINGRLTGRLDSKTYMVSFEPSARLMRIFVDQELVALSQPLETGEGRDLKFFYNGPQENFAKALNLHQIYFHSINELEKEG